MIDNDKFHGDAAKELLGRRIRARREELGLTQEELAKMLGYKSRSTINKIEMGINDITQSKIEAFAKALETTPSALMGWEKFGARRSSRLHSRHEGFSRDTAKRYENESDLEFALRSEAKNLSDEDLSDVLAFVRKLKSGKDSDKQ